MYTFMPGWYYEQNLCRFSSFIRSLGQRCDNRNSSLNANNLSIKRIADNIWTVQGKVLTFKAQTRNTLCLCYRDGPLQKLMSS